jgi:hypothetical protein
LIAPNVLGRPSADQTEYFPSGDTLCKKKKKEEETKLQNPEHPPSVKSFSTPLYIEKTEGLQHLQTPALNLHGRCRSTDEEISRETGLDAKGVTPELLRLKFYCS